MSVISKINNKGINDIVNYDGVLLSNINNINGLDIAPPIVTDNLTFLVDAGDTNSYPGTGTSWRDIVSNNNGTLFGGATYSSADGGSFFFDGVNDYAQFNFFNSVNSQGTITQWFKPAISWNGSNPSQNMRLSGIHYHWEFGRTNSGTGAFAFDLGNATQCVTSKTSWSSSEWYSMTISWNSTAGLSRVYVNGVLDNTGNSQTFSSNGNYAIGRSNGFSSSQYWYGNISTVKYYDDVLSDAEVLQNYNALKGRYGH